MTLSPKNRALVDTSNPALVDVRNGGCQGGLTDSDLNRLLDAARAEGREQERDAAAEDAAGEDI